MLWREKIFKELILRSWWVLLFALICGVFHLHGKEKQERHLNDLLKKLSFLGNEKQQLFTLQNDYLLQLKSQNDPAWIEMVLKRKLGVAGEGERKVYFEDEIER